MLDEGRVRWKFALMILDHLHERGVLPSKRNYLSVSTANHNRVKFGCVMPSLSLGCGVSGLFQHWGLVSARGAPMDKPKSVLSCSTSSSQTRRSPRRDLRDSRFEIFELLQFSEGRYYSGPQILEGLHIWVSKLHLDNKGEKCGKRMGNQREYMAKELSMKNANHQPIR